MAAGFDIDHDVELLIGKRQVFRLALHELKTWSIIGLTAEFHGLIRQIETCIGSRMKVVEQEVGPTSPAAAHFQHFFTRDGAFFRKVVIHLKRGPL